MNFYSVTKMMKFGEDILNMKYKWVHPGSLKSIPYAFSQMCILPSYFCVCVCVFQRNSYLCK